MVFAKTNFKWYLFRLTVVKNYKIISNLQHLYNHFCGQTNIVIETCGLPGLTFYADHRKQHPREFFSLKKTMDTNFNFLNIKDISKSIVCCYLKTYDLSVLICWQENHMFIISDLFGRKLMKKLINPLWEVRIIRC